MDNTFNGWRYSATLDCLIDDNGEKMRMRRGSTQIFLLLKQNMNKLVTRELLLRRVPTDNGVGSDDALSDDTLNECINEIRHVVSDDHLKTIPHVGYLLTPDAKKTTVASTDIFFGKSLLGKLLMGKSLIGKSVMGRSVNNSKVRTATSNDRVRRPVSALVQDLVFNSQWVICGFQKSPTAWIGTFVLIALLLLSSFGTSASTTTGHMAYDRTSATDCLTSVANPVANCSSCIPGFWHTSYSNAHSNWFLPSGCSHQ